MSDDQIRRILNRDEGWEVLAKELAGNVYQRMSVWINDHYNNLSERLEGRECASEAAFRLYERWRRQIEDGNFLMGMDVDVNANMPLFESVNHYLSGTAFHLTIITVRKEWAGKNTCEEKSIERGALLQAEVGRLEYPSGIDAADIGDVDISDEDMREIDEAMKRGLLPSPSLNRLPKRLTKLWLTAVHMSWPRLETDDSHRELIQEAMAELQTAATAVSHSTEEWLRIRSDQAQKKLSDELQSLRMKAQNAESLVDVSFFRLQKIQARPKVGNALPDGYEEAYRKARRDLEACRNRLHLISRKLCRGVVESLLLQFRPQTYQSLFGGTVEYDNASRRRLRMIEAMPKVFKFGDAYQPALRLDVGEEDHESK